MGNHNKSSQHRKIITNHHKAIAGKILIGFVLFFSFFLSFLSFNPPSASAAKTLFQHNIPVIDYSEKTSKNKTADITQQNFSLKLPHMIEEGILPTIISESEMREAALKAETELSNIMSQNYGAAGYSVQPQGNYWSYNNGNVAIDVWDGYYGSIHYNVAHILARRNPFQTAFSWNQWADYSSTGYWSGETCQHAAQRLNAVFLVNGDFRDANYGKNLGIIRHSNIINYQPALSKKAIGLTADGHFCPIGGMSPENVLSSGITDTFTFGPLLIQDYQIQPSLNNEQRSARNMVGETMRSDGLLEYYFIVNAGVTNQYGITIAEGAQMMAALGCQFAYNLDGGGSADMIWKGQSLNQHYREDGDFLYIPY